MRSEKTKKWAEDVLVLWWAHATIGAEQGTGSNWVNYDGVGKYDVGLSVRETIVVGEWVIADGLGVMVVGEVVGDVVVTGDGSLVGENDDGREVVGGVVGCCKVEGCVVDGVKVDGAMVVGVAVEGDKLDGEGVDGACVAGFAVSCQ